MRPSQGRCTAVRHAPAQRAAVAVALGLAMAVTAGCGSSTSSPPDPYAHLTKPPTYFRTLPPGTTLPSGAQCARWVRARPIAENKGVNTPYNQTKGQHVSSDFLASDAPQADQTITPRIDGDFTGTTAQILRWAACKWGISQDIVFAQASVES